MDSLPWGYLAFKRTGEIVSIYNDTSSTSHWAKDDNISIYHVKKLIYFALYRHFLDSLVLTIYDVHIFIGESDVTGYMKLYAF